MSAVVRERVGWDLASAALFVVIVILAFTLPPRFPGSSWFLVATAVGIAAVYAFGARRYVSLREGPEPSPPVSWLLQAALIALLAIGTSIEPTMMLLQTIVLPLIWMTSRSTRQSILVTLLNAVVLSIAYAASDGFSPGMLLAGVVTSGLPRRSASRSGCGSRGSRSGARSVSACWPSSPPPSTGWRPRAGSPERLRSAPASPGRCTTRSRRASRAS